MVKTMNQGIAPAADQSNSVKKKVNEYRNASEAVKLDMYLFHRELREQFESIQTEESV